jgi:hypothetical protein
LQTLTLKNSYWLIQEVNQEVSQKSHRNQLEKLVPEFYEAGRRTVRKYPSLPNIDWVWLWSMSNHYLLGKILNFFGIPVFSVLWLFEPATKYDAEVVYAVEASNMAQYAHKLVQSNHLGDKITVIAGKIEEIDLPEKVDIILSEPMGYMLFNERMLDTYFHAKKVAEGSQHTEI